MNLSKSKYVLGTRCEKLLWLSCYKKEEQEESNDNILENGNKVGELARNLFGEDYILINYNDNYSQMIKETKKNLDNKPNIICEASFSYDGNFCSIDILKNDNDGVEIYEVKSSTEINESYISDISYQTWILKKCGLKVKKSSIVYINSKYTREYKLDLNKLFKIEDVTSLINYEVVEKNIDRFKNIIENKQEPKIDLSLVCKKSKKIFSYDCPYFKYCTKELPHPNVFDIGWNVHFSKKLEMYHNNKITFNEIINDNDFNEKANKQLEFEVYNLKDKVDEKEIKDFLDSITYPLYFLDFESYQEPIPRIVGTKPYQQICFQYSLHYYLTEDGPLYHTDFLSHDYNGNPMNGLCRKLLKDIPKNACILVYNDSFEKSRLKEMAELFPNFKDDLLNIEKNIKDLLPLFKNQNYYVKEMEGSSSIKKVLPALFPNDSSLDYHNLEQVHKGDEASNAYLSLPSLEEEKELELRNNMLKYCALDTYAMVKIYDKLKELINK